ncbi:MAG: hypothetical protein M0Z64_08125 [Nitrospiraceae bacterium]|nr:hypothetical protein [Nitrospiraceae bacterium]
MENKETKTGEINIDCSCQIHVNPEDIKMVADNYKSVLPAVTGDLADMLQTAIALFRPQFEYLNSGLADWPEAFKVWQEAWTILYFTLNEKGLKQYDGISVESLTVDKDKFNGSIRPALESSINELQGIIDNATELQNKLKVLIGGNTNG